MGLGPAGVQLTLELHQRGLFKGIKSVVEIGSQELHVREAQFEALVLAAGVTGYRPDRVPDIGNYPNEPRSSARPFYEMLGVERYACIDINNAFGAIAHDMNLPFDDPAHVGQYDLVTDHGSCEHAFNIAECYRTLHKLCRPGGFILAIQQVFGGNGYYNFDRSFFEGLAATNGYKIVFAGHVITPQRAEQQFLLPIAAALLDVIDWGKVGYLGIAYVFQKLGDLEFQVPYQGSYLSDAQAHHGFNIQFSHEPPGRTFVPVFSLDGVRTKTLARTLARRVREKFFR